MTMKALQRVELASSASTIVFNSIPQTHTDLVILFSGRSDRSTYFDNIRIIPNGTGSGSMRNIFGSGSSASSNTENYVSGYTAGNTVAANVFGSSSIYIFNYTSAEPKSFSMENVGENNTTASVQAITSGFWTGTDPITSLTIDQGDGSNWAAGTSATLYGISRYATTASPKATGGIVSFANGYWVHTFTASGTFTPSENLTNVEYVVVAGGGGSGGGTSGGGGAGGYRSSVVGESSGGGAAAEARLSLTSGTGYTVTVGAGGAAGLTDGSNGGTGSNSVFGSITSLGGGGGDHAGTSQSGGSGGGAGYGTRTGGPGTAGQGYAGGNTSGTTSPYFTCGGGGGAGALGGSVSLSYVGGSGGIGVQSSITGTAIYRAGGGAGGTGSGTVAGGLGGGGASIDNQNGVAGTANTGGGAGGPGTNAANSGAAGGSGIVIVRYPA